MGLETATYINDLDATNPVSSDKKKQGDDHLRLIKLVLKQTIPNGDRPFRIPEVVSKTLAYSVAATDDGKTIICDTTAGSITLTLPAPTFDGWMVRAVKTTTDVNPVFVVPPSGTINGLAKMRLNVPFVEYVFLWTGSTFLRLKAPGEASPGSLEWTGKSTAPVGYALFTGQSLVKLDYPELFEAWGVAWGTVDGTHFTAPSLTSGRTPVAPGGTFDFAETGGGATLTIGQVNIPNYNLPFDLVAANHAHAPPSGALRNFNGVNADVPYSSAGAAALSFAGNTGNSGTLAVTGTVASGGSATPLDSMNPFVVMNPIFRLC